MNIQSPGFSSKKAHGQRLVAEVNRVSAAPAHPKGLCKNQIMSDVPNIDLRNPGRSELDDVDAACRDHGFFFLSGHGLDDLIERTFDQSERFFAAPRVVKESLRRTEQGPLGWYDRELTKRFRDCKEVFDYMEPDGPLGEKLNRWPRELEGFREAQLEFFRAFSELAKQTVTLVHRALGTPASRIAEMGGSPASSTARLNHYPTHDPLTHEESESLPELGPTALGDHTDPGILTLLLQDETGGLQTLHSVTGGSTCLRATARSS